MIQGANIIVGGGTGFIGRHLVRSLRQDGAKVRILTRNPVRGCLDHISWDAIRHNGLPEDTDAVINLAGKNILHPTPWTPNLKQEVYKSRTETNQLLAEAIRNGAKPVRAFATVSGVGYYKSDHQTEYDENWTHLNLEKSKLTYLMSLASDWEKSSELNEQKEPETRRIVIRAGAVLGRDGGIIANMKLPFLFGLGGPLGDGKQWFPWIHVEDLVNLFKFSIVNEHVSGIINGVSPEQVRNEEFTKTFARLLNRPAFIRVPRLPLDVILGKDRSEILFEGMRVKTRAPLLGFRFKYPCLEDACKETLGIKS